MAVENDNVLNLRQKRREKVCQNMHIETPNNSYADILQRLVRRYLFKLERQKEEGKRHAGGIHTPRGYGEPSRGYKIYARDTFTRNRH